MSRKFLLSIVLGACLLPQLQAQTFLNKDEATWTGVLDQGKTAARRGAAFALGRVGHAPAISVLKTHLKNDPDEWVREACGCALGEIALNNADDVKEVLDLLADTMHGPKEDKSPQVRRAAAFAVGCLGKNASPALDQLREAALSDKSPVVRQNAAWALGKVGPQSVETLKKVLADDADALVKRDAALSMEDWKKEEIHPALGELARLCRIDNSEVRRAALIVLINKVTPKDDAYTRDILAAIDDKDDEVRNNAALTLGNIGGENSAGAVPQLLKALTQKSNPGLRQQAAAALRNIGPAAKDAVPTLIEALSDSDNNLHRFAAVALGGIGEEARDAYLPLLKVVEDPSEEEQARVSAAFALSRMGKFDTARDAVPRLLKIVSSAEQPAEVRARVLWALKVHKVDGLVKMDGVVPTFTQVLKENKTGENKMLRYDCAYMLGLMLGHRVDSFTLDTLCEFLQDSKIGIYAGTTSKAGGIHNEGHEGKAEYDEQGRDDGRVMVTQALDNIGAAVFFKRLDIIAELHKLANDPDTYSKLKEDCQTLLKKERLEEPKVRQRRRSGARGQEPETRGPRDRATAKLADVLWARRDERRYQTVELAVPECTHEGTGCCQRLTVPS